MKQDTVSNSISLDTYKLEVEFIRNRKPNSKWETWDKTLHLFKRPERKVQTGR